MFRVLLLFVLVQEHNDSYLIYINILLLNPESFGGSVSWNYGVFYIK